MRKILPTLAALAMLAAAPQAFASQAAATAAPPAPPTAQDWARLPAIQNVSLSQDGKYVMGVTSPDGRTPVLSIWNIDQIERGPVTLGGNERARLAAAFWIKKDRIAVVFREQEVQGAQKDYFTRTFIADQTGKLLFTLTGDRDLSADIRNGRDVGLVNTLPLNETEILVNIGGELNRLNVYNGSRSRAQRDSDRFTAEQADLNGEVRARQRIDFDNGRVFIAQEIKHPTTGAWDEHFRWYAENREPMELVGFTRDPNIVFVRTNRGRDKAAIFEYDVQNRRLLEPAFEHPLFDALDVVQLSTGPNFGEVVGFSYAGVSTETFWIDPTIKAAEDAAKQALGERRIRTDWTDIATGERKRVSYADGFSVSVVDWSEDLTRFLVLKSGPNVRAEYYLLVNGQLRLLARSAPWIRPESLGEMRLVQYPARDGLMIPAYLTTPPKARYGEGPYPTIILPHGGPWNRDDLSWDDTGWVQWFAAQGYAVLQPQFRGSEGWGQRLWRAGDAEWGQKMQDDKDDGARWLIAQGVAAPERIAMHGFSYGGYSAMAAAVRPNGLYQCAVAGAGVSDLELIKRGVFSNRFQREFQRPTIEGLDPLRRAQDVSIPVMLYHGDFDQRVEIKHSEIFDAALRAAGKDVHFVRIPGMSHSSGDLPEHKVTVLTEIDRYLKTRCGPGGL